MARVTDFHGDDDFDVVIDDSRVSGVGNQSILSILLDRVSGRSIPNGALLLGLERVNLEGFVVNSHTSPFDLSVFGFEPSDIKAAP